MDELYMNLLEEPCFSTTGGADGPRSLSLAQVLARLSRGEALEFTALQAQQQQPWHSFLVQLAALALHASEQKEIENGAEDWSRQLRALAKDESAWALMVEDLSRPAFFQPPVPEANLAGFKRSSANPEILDVLITAKNFDVKTNRFTAAPAAEHWAYALITLQTMQGFLGRGNYGIARMNGGFASRPEVALAPNLGTGARFRRDLRVLLEERRALLDDHGFDDRGHSLLWTLPWQGEASEALGIEDLDPFYLEVCRRVRLAETVGELRAFVAPTQGPRVNAKEQLGNLGDPWTPVSKKGTALTVNEDGFHYRRVHELLFGDEFKKPAALRLRPEDKGSAFAVMRVLARGQGKTGGFHERILPIPSRVANRFRQAEGRKGLAEESEYRIEKAGEMRKRVLKLSLLALTQEKVGAGPTSKFNFKDQGPDPWLRRFDQAVDRVFFTEFFDDLERDLNTSERHQRWECRLLDIARTLFYQAQPSLAPSGVHRYRALARSESLFHALARQTLNLAYEEAGEPSTTTELREETSP